MAEQNTAAQEAFEAALVKKNEAEAAQAAMGVVPEVVEGEEGEGPVLQATTPVQTTYPSGLRPGVAGAIVNEEPVVLISRNVEDAAGIAFGLAVIQGTADKGCKLGPWAAGKFLGATVRERSIGPDFPNGFAQYSSARIMNKGVIWVAVTAAVVAGDVVAFNSVGQFGKGAGAAGDVVGARWETTQATVGGLAQLRLG